MTTFSAIATIQGPLECLCTLGHDYLIFSFADLSQSIFIELVGRKKKIHVGF